MSNLECVSSINFKIILILVTVYGQANIILFNKTTIYIIILRNKIIF